MEIGISCSESIQRPCAFLPTVNVFTLGVLKAINRVVPVKVGRMDEKKGLDLGYHGEVARQ